MFPSTRLISSKFGLYKLPRCPISSAESGPQNLPVGVLQPHYSEEIRRAPEGGSFPDANSALCIQQNRGIMNSLGQTRQVVHGQAFWWD